MASNSSRDSASSTKFVYPPPIVLRVKRDFKQFNDVLLSIGQRVNMTEELVYSISTKNTDLQKTYDLRFEGVDLERRPPLTGYEANDFLSPNKSPTGSSPSQIRRSSGNSSDQGSSARGGRRFKSSATRIFPSRAEFRNATQAAFDEESAGDEDGSRNFSTP
jgi:hypothetical protein